jgi:signal-transduction protein with cAMP-binding, CBS, and nucleotidyltransferase domain
VAEHEGGDGFDSEILVHQSCRHDFFVREEAICYALPMEDFLELERVAGRLGALFGLGG